MSFKKKYNIGSVVISLCLFSAVGHSFGLGDLAKQVAEKVVVDKATETVSDAVMGEGDASSEAVSAPQDLASAGPIADMPMAIELKATRGSVDVFAKRPRVALAGYNVGAFQTASITGTTTREQGASVNMDLTLQGVDAGLLQKIADAGQADLVRQLQEAGIDVIDAPSFFQAPEAAEVHRSATPVDDKKMDGRAPKKLIMNGPSSVGAVTSFGLVSTGFNANVGDQASAALDAIVVYPNVALDFAWTSGGGRSMLQKTVSVNAGARFSLDAISSVQVIYSRDGRYVDDAATLGIEEDIGVDDAFANLEKTASTDNSGVVGLSNALGFGMSSRKGESYTVAADPARYEALAMNAVRGFNTALVKQIKAGKKL